MNQITTCPHCSKRIRVSEQITDKTLICPHCLAEVDNTQPGAQIKAPDLNTDVKRDLNVGTIVLAVLIGLCILGFLVSISSPRSGSETVVEVAASFFCLFSLVALVVVVIIAGVRLVQRGRAGVSVSQIDKALGCVLLVLGTIASFVIFILFACAMAMRDMQWGK